MASLWLTVARYGEDQAHLVDSDEQHFYPNAYHYRQWVIDAFNRDLPYDDFVRYQLAADLMEGDASPNLAALGYLGLGPKYYQRTILQVKADEWEERVDMVSRSLLGLTVACARCHDHKYDPITARDYHALAGVFASLKLINRPEMELVRHEKSGNVIEVIPPPETLHLVEEGEVQDLPIFIRGDVENKGEIVPRGFLQILAEGLPQEFKHGSGRLELAEAIVSTQNPLTARVIVNRIWGTFFGRPLVATASNFGALGARPESPELLDDLAARFMENGWSMKGLIREIVLSATYRQGSVNPVVSMHDDPENVHLSRKSRRRMTAEMWRDAMLVASEGLEIKGGASGEVDDPSFLRRTVFGKISRLSLNPYLAQFDYPDANVHSAKRLVTTTPTQKLFFLNGSLIDSRAAALAEQLMSRSENGSRAQVLNLYERLFSRPATETEIELALAFLGNDGNPSKDDWHKYVQVLLTSNEMLYLD
jgi:hypothetical protein